MTFEQLLQTQWSEYADRHRDRVNLLIHIVAVPLFWIGSFNAIGVSGPSIWPDATRKASA